jgi:hypothetical protein
VRPYERVRENFLEVTLLSLALISYSASVFLAGSLEVTKSDANVVNDVISILNVIVKYILIILVVITYAPTVKRSLRRLCHRLCSICAPSSQ